MYDKEVSLEDKEGNNAFFKEISQSSRSYGRKKSKTHSVKFFDFFLHVILKIMLIPEWNKLGNLEEK